jgi:acid stress chaperone HdeB
MKQLLAAFAATIVIASTIVPAFAADDIDMSTIKCKDFLTSGDDEMGMILVWLQGYYTKENDPPVLRVDKMKTDAGNLGKYCKEHGSDGLITAANKVMPVK